MRCGTLVLEAALFSLDGARRIAGRIEGDKQDAARLGEELAVRIKKEGGAEILEEIRKTRPLPISQP